MAKSSEARERIGGGPGQGPPEALGEAEVFLDFQDRLSRVAKVDRPVLLIGERGTGKELAAARLHFLSRRWQGPMVTLNCATLAESLLESELFGHEAGAFTGAVRRRQGRFEAASGGTLFLDEIGQIPMVVQEKILRVVEYRRFERVGATDPTEVDVRIIGATHADLPRLAREGKFKEDLLDRLSFEVLFLPPLRERREDILLLGRHFATRMALEIGLEEAPEFAEEAVEALEGYAWPGNIRELKNVVERAVYACVDGVIREIDFHPFHNPYAPLPREEEAKRAERRPEGTAPTGAGAGGTRAVEVEVEAGVAGGGESGAGGEEPGADYVFRLGRESLKEGQARLEQTCLRRALERAQFNQRRAADLLGINYHQFRGLYRKHAAELGLDRKGGAGGQEG